ncbi:hypothetical protein JCM21900_000471 [Sporobolomyces salmonicolor]
MSSPASFAPVSPSVQQRPRSASRSRSLHRRPSQGALSTPSRPSGAASAAAASSSSSAASGAPPTPALPPAAALLAAASSSPHYTTSLRSRHSLYGTEDRVVLDLGSRVWKVGFSGETGPRGCLSWLDAGGGGGGGGGALALGLGRDGDGKAGEIWGLGKGESGDEQWEVREERVTRALRDLWFDHLMTDPKTRKVLVVENPLLPTRVKEMIARVLFDNLQVPSVNFASAPLLALMAAGTVTGLVVDVGHLETTVLPIFHARPLFPLVTSTPLAGSAVNSRLRLLLLAFGSYVPPPSSLNSMTVPKATRVPREVLSEELIEEIKTRMCFVGEEVPEAREPSAAMDLDTSEEEDDPDDPDASLLKHLYARYAHASPTTTTLSLRIPSFSPSPSASPPVGKGHLLVPSWIRGHAASSILFDSALESDDALSVQSAVLECLLKLPIDLRKTMAGNVLVTGGTAALPGFFPRFKDALLTQLERAHPPSPPPSPPPSSPTTTDPARALRRRALALRLHTLRHSPRYAPLTPLAPHLCLLNHPSPSASSSSSPVSSLRSSQARLSEGSAPAFHPALQAWVGGSLAGALKVGGEEVLREQWDASREAAEPEEEELLALGENEDAREGGGGGRKDGRERQGGGRVPDWTRVGI